MENEILNQEEMQDEGAAGGGEPVSSESEGGAEGSEGGAKSAAESESKGAAAQSAEQNAKNAERRRAAEGVGVKAVREQAIIEALGGVNPFTHEEMRDSEDVEEYLAMREIEKSGGDPVTDLPKYQKQKAREKRVAMENEVQEKQRIGEDVEDFKAQYPDADIGSLLEDEGFGAFAEGKLGRVPLSQIYRDYEAFAERLTGARRDEAKKAQALANNKAGVGSLASSHKEEPGYYTPEQVRAMTEKEVKANYEKIMESMKKWK